MKDLQNEEIFDGRYAVDVYKLRSIKPSPRAIAECSIDREKFLRIGVSMGMRAMRAVFCQTLRQKIVLLAAPRFAGFDHGPPKPSGMPFKPLPGSSTTRGP